MRKIIYVLLIIFILFSTFLFLTSCTSEQASEDSFLRGFFLDRKQMDERGHAERINEYCSDNITAYLNEDGIKTLYINSGLIEKSKNYIIESASGFNAEGSYVSKHFSESLNEDSGIYIKKNSNDKNFINIFLPEEYSKGKGGISSIKGELTENENTFGQKMECVFYKNALGNGSDLYVYPTVYGVNTEIIIPDGNSEASYRFRVKLPDIFPETTSPDYIIMKNNNDEAENLSMIYTPLLTDSGGKWSYKNTVELISKDTQDNSYIVEFHMDREFMQRGDIKYPLVMNQSFYLAHAAEPDTSAYSLTNDDARHYLSPYMLIGNNTSKGEGRTYIRFESLDELEIEPEDIISAKYHFRNLYDLPDKAFIGLYAVTSDWCSINTMWHSIPQYDENMVTSVLLDKKGDYSMEITPLIKKIMENKGNEVAMYSVRNGFFIKAESEDIDMLIAAGDSGLYSPCLELRIKK